MSFAVYEYTSADIMVISMVAESSPVYDIRRRAFYFSRDIILFVRMQSRGRVYHSVYDQLIRSATSVGANLTESLAGSSKKDFIYFNVVALKSANEVKYWLSLINETLEVDRERTDLLLKEAIEIANIIAAIVIKSKGDIKSKK